MKLKGDSERIDDKFVKFKLSATRLEIVDNEYLPNSESLRVEIYDSNNSIIFNSSLGQNFFMAIMDVEPKEIGETKTFEYLWDYKDNFKKKVKPGKYSVRLIIPAMPDQYFTTIEFEILN
jgi:hypothetical protein